MVCLFLVSSERLLVMETLKFVSRGLLRYVVAFLATVAVVVGVTQIPQTGRVLEVDQGDITLSAAYDDPDGQVKPLPNNDLPRRCGVNVALVFDMSASIGELGRQKSVEAGKGIVEQLEGAPVNVGVFNFATQAPVDGTENLAEPVSVFEQGGVDRVKDNINNLKVGTGFSYAGTNWEGALNDVADAKAKYDVVYFITDGVPTTNSNNDSGPGTAKDPGQEMHNVDLSMAVEAANRLKDEGTRIVPIAIGLESMPKHPVFKSSVNIANRRALFNAGEPYLDQFGPYYDTDQYGNPIYYNDPNGYRFDSYYTETRASGEVFTTMYHSEDVLYLELPKDALAKISDPYSTEYISNYGELSTTLINQLRNLCKNSILVEKTYQDANGDTYTTITDLVNDSNIPREDYANWSFKANLSGNPDYLTLVDANGTPKSQLEGQVTDKKGVRTIPFDFADNSGQDTGTVRLAELIPSPTADEFWSPGDAGNGESVYCYDSATKQPVSAKKVATQTGESLAFDVTVTIDTTTICRVANKFEEKATVPDPKLEIQKKINGQDADSADEAVSVKPGEDMEISYEVTNSGSVKLFDVKVVDKVTVAKDDATKAALQKAIEAELGKVEAFDLAAGESKTVTITVKAVEGAHTNMAKAVGVPPSSEDPEKPGDPDDSDTPPVESPEDPGNTVSEDPTPTPPGSSVPPRIPFIPQIPLVPPLTPKTSTPVPPKSKAPTEQPMPSPAPSVAPTPVPEQPSKPKTSLAETGANVMWAVGGGLLLLLAGLALIAIRRRKDV